MRYLLLLLLIVGCSRQASETAPAGEPQAPSIHAPAAGGTDFGGGGERGERPKARHWFPARDFVFTCLRAAPDYPVKGEALKKLVSGAFDRWNEYLREKGVSTQLEIYPQWGPDCADAELIFLFGEWDPALDEARKLYRDPLAFAHKPEQGAGYLWFSKEAAETAGDLGLETMALHEIGHAYGNGHIPGTIMAEDTASHLARIPRGSVDLERELVTCAECLLSLAQTEWEPNQIWERNFALQSLLGRDPKGNLKVEVFRVPRLMLNLSLTLNRPNIFVKISDEQGASLWNLTGMEEAYGQPTEAEIFRVGPGTPFTGKIFSSMQYRFEAEDGNGHSAVFVLEVGTTNRLLVRFGAYDQELASPKPARVSED